MALTVTILAVALASCLLSYYYLWLTPATLPAAEPPAWPPAGVGPPGLWLPSAATLLLLASAGAMRWAETGIRAGRQRDLWLGMAGSWILGAAFVAIQVALYLGSGLFLQGSAYGSVFLVTLAFHMARAVTGLLIGGFVLAQAWAGFLTRWRWLPVQNAALYWYFVVAGWLAVFTVLYASPRLL